MTSVMGSGLCLSAVCKKAAKMKAPETSPVANLEDAGFGGEVGGVQEQDESTPTMPSTQRGTMPTKDK